MSTAVGSYANTSLNGAKRFFRGATFGVCATLSVLVLLVISTFEAGAGWKEKVRKTIKAAEEHTKRVYEGPVTGVADIKRDLKELQYLYKNPGDFLNVCQKLYDDAQKHRGVANNKQDDFLTQLRGVTSIPQEGVVLYNARGPASLTFNVRARTYGYTVTMPNGVVLEKGRMKSSAGGKPSIPSGDPKPVVKNSGYAQVNLIKGYNDWVQTKGNPDRHVYLASKRFVDFFSDDKAAQDLGWAVVTRGETLKGSLATAKEQLVLEWADLLSWLRQVGEDEGKNGEAARDIVEEILEIVEDAKLNKFDPTKLKQLTKTQEKWKALDLKAEARLF